MKFQTDITALKALREKSLSIVDTLNGEALAQELARLHNLEICIQILESKIPLDKHPFLIKEKETVMDNYYQVPKELLLVNNEQDIYNLHGQALDIAGYGRTLDANLPFICMMHQPQEGQLADLRAQQDELDMPVALVGGQLGLMTQLIPCLIKDGYAVFEAKTDRISQEQTQPDGSVRKVNIFQHAGLRRLA